MSYLHIPYSDLEAMPLEYLDWFYKKAQSVVIEQQEKMKNATASHK